MQNDERTDRHNEDNSRFSEICERALKSQIHMANLTQSQYVMQNTYVVKGGYHKLEDLGVDVRIILTLRLLMSYIYIWSTYS